MISHRGYITVRADQITAALLMFISVLLNEVSFMMRVVLDV